MFGSSPAVKMTAPLSSYLSGQVEQIAIDKPKKDQFYSYASKKLKWKKKKKRRPRRKITEGTTTICGCGKPIKYAVPLLCEDCYITKTFVRRD